MDFLIYFLKSSFVLGIFLFVYSVFLKKETFFHLNRIFLLGGILIAVFLPLLSFKTSSSLSSSRYIQEIPIYLNSNFSAEKDYSSNFSWLFLLAIGYFIGIFYLLIRFFKSLKSLFQLLNHAEKIKTEKGIIYYKTQKEISPFSIFKSIIFNPELHTKEELNHILLHEFAHVKKKHSYDILLSQLFCIFFWFNPFVWIYHQKIIQNIEFEADAEATSHLDSTKSYQYSLVKNSLPVYQYIPTINFYQSFLKTRIMMLQKEKSNRLSILKIGFVFPFLLAFFLGFQLEIQAQEKVVEKTEEVAFQKIEQPPIYPGCEDLKNTEEAKNCMTQKISALVNENFKTEKFKKDSTLQGRAARINVQFTVDQKGEISTIQTRAETKDLEKEAERVVKLIPTMKPGIQDENPVSVIYQLPIVFALD